MIEEKENVVLIHVSHEHESTLCERCRKLLKDREEFRRRVREAINDPETQEMYRDPEINLDL
jgi:RNase P subunit RPR2